MKKMYKDLEMYEHFTIAEKQYTKIYRADGGSHMVDNTTGYILPDLHPSALVEPVSAFMTYYRRHVPKTTKPAFCTCRKDSKEVCIFCTLANKAS